MSLPPTATIAEIEAKRREMGLDKPLPQQYLIWLTRRAARRFRPLHRVPPRCRIAGRRHVAGDDRACRLRHDRSPAILGLGGGLLLFHLRGTPFEPVADLGSILLLSIPEFLWGLILLFVFGVVLHWLPFTGQSRRTCRCRTSPAFC